MKQTKIFQPNVSDHLLTHQKFNGNSHFQALNNDVFNTLTIDQPINKEILPDHYANFQQTVYGIDQFSSQIQTFAHQANLLNLTGQNEHVEAINQVVSQLQNTRDKALMMYEKMALNIKGTQFFNTCKLSDLFLMNDKGISQMPDDQFNKMQLTIFKKAFGKNIMQEAGK